MSDGASVAEGSVIFIQRTPGKPWRSAIIRAFGCAVLYQSSWRRSSSGWFQVAQWKLCHITISRWNLPCQEL